jgi:phosphatidylglycerophosphate synthase
MKEGFKLSDFLDDAEDDYLVLCVLVVLLLGGHVSIVCTCVVIPSGKVVGFVVICVELYCQSKRKGKNKCWIQ